jgi:AcrR family transcriptional regulator
LNVVQESPVEAVGLRARNRLARHAGYLRTARRLVSAEGLDALTMQRMADELGCAVGTIYTYFPSKSALIAEVQREAIEKLMTSYLLARADLDRSLRRADATKTALSRLVGFGRFWITTTTAFPEESQLLQSLMAEVRPSVDQADAMRVLPAAMRLLDFARACFDDAAAADALTVGDGMERAVILAAALNGVLLTSKLSVWDEELLDAHRLAHRLLIDLLVGWGADRKAVSNADRHIDSLAMRGPLAPPVPDLTEET